MRSRARLACMLLLAVCAAPLAGAQRIWNGSASSAVSNPANWNGGVAPGEGDDLYFPDVANKQVVFDAGQTVFAYRSLNVDVAGYRFDAAPNYGARLFSQRCDNSFAIVAAPPTGTITFAPGLILVLACDRVIGADGGRLVFESRTFIAGSLRFLSAVLFPSSRYSTFVLDGSIGSGGRPIIADYKSHVIVNGDLDLDDTLQAVSSGVLEINSQGRDVTVRGGTIRGHGTLGGLSSIVATDLTPGHDQHGGSQTLTVGDAGTQRGSVTLDGPLHVHIWGPTSGVDSNLLRVHGAVQLGAAARLALHLEQPPELGQSFTLIDNAGTAPIQGAFQGLPEGATFTLHGFTFRITYVGGDGNDVLIRVEAVPLAAALRRGAGGWVVAGGAESRR